MPSAVLCPAARVQAAARPEPVIEALTVRSSHEEKQPVSVSFAVYALRVELFWSHAPGEVFCPGNCGLAPELSGLLCVLSRDRSSSSNDFKAAGSADA